MKVTINGKQHEMQPGKDKIEYKTICELAGESPLSNPSVIYSNKYGEGILAPGQVLLITEDTKIECICTGNA